MNFIIACIFVLAKMAAKASRAARHTNLLIKPDGTPIIPIRIALVGLVSVGKSSIVNSLVGRRLLASGIARTTMEVTHIEGLTSDDGYAYEVYDTMGVADSDDKTNEFDKVMLDSIVKADVVLFVTSSDTAFITTHERTEFENVIKFITNHTIATGKAIQYGIIVSKVDIDPAEFAKFRARRVPTPATTPPAIGPDNAPIIVNATPKKLSTMGRIIRQPTQVREITGVEDTTKYDSLERVWKLFPELTEHNIMMFNAFGRVLYNSDGSISQQLKSFVVSQFPTAQNHNIDFKIQYYCDNIEAANQNAAFLSLIASVLPKLASDITSMPQNCPHGFVFQNCAQDCIVTQAAKFTQVKELIPKLSSNKAIIKSLFELLMCVNEAQSSKWFTEQRCPAIAYNEQVLNLLSKVIELSYEPQYLTAFIETLVMTDATTSIRISRLFNMYGCNSMPVLTLYHRYINSIIAPTVVNTQWRPEIIVQSHITVFLIDNTTGRRTVPFKYDNAPVQNYQLPLTCEIDREYTLNYDLAARKSFVAKVASIRRRIYGYDAEDDVLTTNILLMTNRTNTLSLFRPV